MLLNASSLAMGCVSLWEMELSVTASFHTFPSHSWDSTLLASCFCLLSMAPVPRTITPFMPYRTFLFCCLLHFLFASAKKLLFSQRLCQYPSLELPDCFTSQQLCIAWSSSFLPWGSWQGWSVTLSLYPRHGVHRFPWKNALFLLDCQEEYRLKYVQNTCSWGKGLMVKRSVWVRGK